MPLQIAKSVLMTGIGQESQQVQVTCFHHRDNRHSKFNVTIEDFTGQEVRSPVDWLFVIDHTDPFNVEVLRTITERRNEVMIKRREEWADEKDPKVTALVQRHLAEPPVFYLRHLGTYPGVIVVGMGAMLFARGHDRLYVSDVIGDITDLALT